MRTKPPTATGNAVLLSFLLVLALARVAFAQEAEPSQEQGSTAGEEVTAQETVEPQPVVEEPLDEPTPPGEAFPLASALEGEEQGLEMEARLPASIEQPERFWQVIGLYELHFNLVSDDYSANDWSSYYMLRGNFDITENNQLGLRFDMDQLYIADPDESGLWFGDIRLYYTRFFTLPIPDFRVPARAFVYLTAPTSRASQERGYITQPTATLRLLPSYGPFSLVADYFFRYSFARYAESSHGATPNNQLLTGFMFWLVYTSPLEWFWPSVLWQSTFSKDYWTREHDWQPWLEDYLFEVALNFTLPLPEQYPITELSLTYSQGSSVLKDGVYRLYFAKRDQTQLYFSLSLTY